MTNRVPSSRPVPPLNPEQTTALMRRLTRAASPAARQVARRLLDLDHGDGAFPGYKALAEHTGLSAGTVRNALAELHGLGAFVGQRGAGLASLKAYFGVAVELWAVHVTRDDDMDSMSREIMTPADSVSPPMSSSMSPPVSSSMSRETMHRSKTVGSSEQEMGSKNPRTRGAALGARPAGGNGAQSKALPTKATRAEAEAFIASLDNLAAAAPNEVERDFLRKTALLKRRQLDALPAPEPAR